MMRRLLVSGGGTGGHVYPLLAVLEALHEADGQVAVLYLGRAHSVEERIATGHGVEFHAVPTGAVVGRAPWRIAANLGQVALGVRRSLQEMSRFRPEAVLVTGGYVSVPAAVAAWLARRPLVVCLPDMEPGLAVRLLARLADRVTVSFDEVRGTLPARKVVVTGYPVRAAFQDGDRAAAREHLGVGADERMLVVLGGSSGARHINEAVLDVLPRLLDLAVVYHITGPLDYERVLAAWQGLDTCVRGRYRIYSYVEKDMAGLLWAADLVIARAGAATLGEFPAAGVPSLLVPGGFAGGHQTVNATYLRDRGAAVILEDAALPGRLLPTVRELLEDSQRLADMASAARRLARPGACRAIVATLERAAEAGHSNGR